MLTKIFIYSYFGLSLYSSYIYYLEGPIGKCNEEDLIVDSIVRGFFVGPPTIVLDNIKYNLHIIYNLGCKLFRI